MNRFFCLAMLAILLGGCPCSRHPPGHGTYGMYYEAIFVLDAGNNLHLFYSNNYANKAWHLERTAGGWKREPLEPVGDPDYQDLVRKGSPWPSFRQAGVEGQHLCTRIGYGVQDQSISYRACLGADGGWTFIRIIEKPSALFYPFVLLNDNEVLRIMNNVNSDTFSLVNQMTGAEREFLAPVEMKLFPSPDPSEGLEQSFGNKRINLVYDQGQWDGTHLIYCIPLERVVNSSASVITERAVCYLLSYQGNSWNAEKILELPYEGGTLSIGDYIHETSLASTVIFWKDRILNTLGTDFFLGKDSVTGKFITEPIPPSYMALFEKLEHSNRRFYRGDAVGAEGSTGFNNFDGNPPGFMSLPSLVDKDGKVHLLVAEGEDFKRDIYYEVYNPDAANPTVPIVREFIEHQED